MGAPGPHATDSAHDAPAAHHHRDHAAHEHHTYDRTSLPPTQPNGDCPHCLAGHAAGNVTTADCDVVVAAPPATTNVPPAVTSALPIASDQGPAASAIPPLIYLAAHATRAPTPSVPLRIRHCVLLI